MNITHVTLALLALVSFPPVAQDAGQAQDPAAEEAQLPGPWRDMDYVPPTELETSRMVMLPLSPEYAELDYEAVMGNRDHLLRTLRWGDWPTENFTLEENTGDLERHWKEFEDREGYAFTVLAPDKSRCLGCIYLKPLGRTGKGSTDARLAFWVVEDRIESEFDLHVLEQTLEWIEKDWPFTRVVIPIHAEDRHGLEVARSLGLSEDAKTMAPSHVVFTWVRGER